MTRRLRALPLRTPPWTVVALVVAISALGLLCRPARAAGPEPPSAPEAPPAEAKGPPPARPAPINLGFEVDAGDGHSFAGWGGASPGYEVVPDHETVHGGATSVRLGAIDDQRTEDTFVPLIQRFTADRWRGKRIRLRGWLRTRDVDSGWAGLWMRIDGPIGPPLAFDNMEDRGPRGTTPWTRYDVVLDVPEGGSMIFFGAVLSGGGTAWVDDLSIEEVDDTVPSTEIEPSDD